MCWIKHYIKGVVYLSKKCEYYFNKNKQITHCKKVNTVFFERHFTKNNKHFIVWKVHTLTPVPFQ